MFTGPEEGLGQVAAHGIKKLFAYADMSINPKIHIYNYPDFKKKKVLKGNDCANMLLYNMCGLP